MSEESWTSSAGPPPRKGAAVVWRAGIVVASASNTGPDPMTIGVPGNFPYVVTVGARTDSYTPGS